MRTNVTCRPIYLEKLAEYTNQDPEKIRLFAAGFVMGQAEKVYLGACKAAMFRPAPADWHLLEEIIQDACRTYGLKYFTLFDVHEMWICREKYYPTIYMRLENCERNSPKWHELRGSLCGVPTNEIDINFHLRSGYGEAVAQPESVQPCV